MPADFKGEARPLSEGDVIVVAGYLGCHVAAVRAVLAVESAGKGFSSDGRPIILNEPHVFYRNLSGSLRSKAVSAGLAYPSWGSKPYPRTQDARYNWLSQAMAIDGTAALKSCSWGLGQVMGFNYSSCGFSTVQEFVEAMKTSEGAQLFAVAQFIVSNGLQKHLRSRNWSGFAYGYNGSQYAKNGYHTKLANAYAKRPLGEKFTPNPATDDQIKTLISGSAVVVPPFGMSPDQVPTWSPNRGVYLKKGGRGPREAELIGDLSTLGYYNGPLDDWFWTGTQASVIEFQRDKKLDVDGIAGPITLDTIDKSLVSADKKKAVVGVVTAGTASAAAGTVVIAAGFDSWFAVLIGVSVCVTFLIMFRAMKN